MLIEATVAIGSGVAAHSLTLIAFGADSIIELLSACVLLWRLSVELRRGQEFSDTAERLGQEDFYSLSRYTSSQVQFLAFWARGRSSL
jgi:hypothetical protein